MSKRGQGARVDLRGVGRVFARGKREPTIALDGIDLAINPGEFVAIVGPSGCGKSTLLRMIASLDSPTAGLVTVDGAPPVDVAKAHELGVAFQEHALLPWLTVQENIGLPYRFAGRPIDRERVNTLIKMVRLSAAANAKPKELSGGMRQRVAIARSLVLDPKVLLLDEPFGALDLVSRRALNFELERVWSELGTTTVLITHSVEEAVLLADRVILMATSPGRIDLDVPVDLPRPRSRAIMHDGRFVALVQKLTESLDNNARGDQHGR